MSALHYSDFIAPRNSEWHFTPTVRDEILSFGAADTQTLEKVHHALLNIGQTGDQRLARSVIPGYLFTKGGQAYHLAALGEVEPAMQLYSSAASGELNGAQWLAELSAEQEAKQIIPSGRIETTFLRAMVLNREGNRKEAEPLFAQISSSDEVRHEVAISCHILAGMIARRSAKDAEHLFRKSIRIKREVHDLEGLAHSLHSLANLIGFRASGEAEELYQESIEIGREIGKSHHVAQALHSFAKMIGRDRNRSVEAEKLYRESIEIGDDHTVAQALHSFANMIGRDRNRSVEAEKLYRESVEILRDIGDAYGVAQTLHSLANMLGRNRERSAEAEDLYRESIQIDRNLGNSNGVAQALHSLGILLQRDRQRIDEAEDLLVESLEILEKDNDLRGQAQVLRTLSFVAETHGDYPKAESLLERALDLNQRGRDRNGVRIVRQSLDQLRKRHDL